MKHLKFLFVLGVQAALACGPAVAENRPGGGGTPIDVRPVAPIAQGPSEAMVDRAEGLGRDASGACPSDEDLVDQRLVMWLARRPEPQAKALAAALARATAASRAPASKDGAPRASIRESIMTLARSLK